MKIDLPVNPGDTVYYVVGTDNPTIDEGKVVGVELLEDNYVRIVIIFNYFRMAIRADLLGESLFTDEDEAKAALKKRREENAMPNLMKKDGKRI